MRGGDFVSRLLFVLSFRGWKGYAPVTLYTYPVTGCITLWSSWSWPQYFDDDNNIAGSSGGAANLLDGEQRRLWLGKANLSEGSLPVDGPVHRSVPYPFRAAAGHVHKRRYRDNRCVHYTWVGTPNITRYKRLSPSRVHFHYYCYDFACGTWSQQTQFSPSIVPRGLSQHAVRFYTPPSLPPPFSDYRLYRIEIDSPLCTTNVRRALYVCLILPGLRADRPTGNWKVRCLGESAIHRSEWPTKTFKTLCRTRRDGNDLSIKYTAVQGLFSDWTRSLVANGCR